MFMSICLKILAMLILTKIIIACNEINDGTFGPNSTDVSETKLLSRRKRFLIFPDGSSFQLVFCTQTHGYLQIGDIIWFGSTAALAWELPTDPEVFDMFRDHKKVYEANKRIDITKYIFYMDEAGKVIDKVPYQRKPIANPAFAKRSADIEADVHVTKQINIKDMHDSQINAKYFNNLHETRIEFHRNGRKSIYIKAEKVLQALGWNGRACILRVLCDTANEKSEQGTFLEEIIRATFTLPKGQEFESEYKQYDVAHGSHGDCAKLYPECKGLPNL